MCIIILIMLFIRVDQCRMKMGLILTGVGDKVCGPYVHKLQPWELFREFF